MANPPLPILLDSTMLTAFRACPKKFYWEYILNLRPSGRSRDLVAGGAFAAGLEAAYIAHFVNGKDLDAALIDAYKAFALSWGDFEREDPTELPANKRSAKTFDRMFEAICFYLAQYPFERDHVRPLIRMDGQPTFEFSFAIPLTEECFPRHPSGDPFLYAGRMDAFGHLDGKLVIRDEKTTGSYFSSRWADQWSFRNQFIGYCWAASQSGYPTDTAVIRGLLIQKTQFQTLEAIKVYSSHVTQIFKDQLARDLHRMVDCWTSGYFDFDIGEACMSYNRPCAFMDLCTDPRPELWFGDFERVRWNPLTRTLDEVSS